VNSFKGNISDYKVKWHERIDRMNKKLYPKECSEEEGVL